MNISRKYNIITGGFADVDEDKSMVADFQDAQTVLMVGLGYVSGEAVLYAECLHEPLTVFWAARQDKYSVYIAYI